MAKKKHRAARSLILRLAVVGAGLALLAWQGRDFSRTSTSAMISEGPIRPLLSIVPRRWHISPVTSAPVAQPTRKIRVRLFGDQSVSDFYIESAGGIRVGKLILIGEVYVSHAGRNLVLTSAAHPVLRAPLLELLGEGSSGIVVRVPGKGSRHTVGTIHVSADRNGLTLVNELALEDYVLGTVEPELGGFDLPMEALKAQIVASRSYVLALHDRHPGRNYDFCDTPHCLMFAGVRKYPVKFRRAATACRGIYLSYKGRPAAAFFHHGCGGETAAVEDVWPVSPVPYLRRVVDGNPPYCRLGRWAEWSFTIDRTSLRRCLAARGWIHGTEALDSLRIVAKSPGGRAQQILIQSTHPRWVSANLFRRVVNSYYQREVLYSTLFTTSREGEWIRFNGKGWGHGVGLCQSGAVHMARQGKSCRAILAHYYPGTSVSVLSDSVPVPLDTDAGARKDLSRLSY